MLPRTLTRILLGIGAATAVAATPQTAVAITGDTQARAENVYETTVKDPAEEKVSTDIKKVRLTSATRNHEFASVVLTRRGANKSGDTYATMLNLDGDKQPDMLITGTYTSSYEVYKMKTWTKPVKDITAKKCAEVYSFDTFMEFVFNPDCLGESKKMQVSATSWNESVINEDPSDLSSVDYAPGKKKWSQKIQSFSPEPEIP